MRFALLGDAAELVPLGQAALAQGHTLSWIGESGPLSAALRELAGKPQLAGAWEVLLDHGAVNGVLIGAQPEGREQRAEQLRRLVQAGIPLLVVHPVSLSTLFYYELDMIRRESQGVLRYVYPGRGHPLLDRLTALAQQEEGDPPGRVEQAIFDRWLASRTRETVLAQLARDFDLLAAICGEQDRVGTLAASPGSDAFATLGIQSLGRSAIVSRWSVSPPQGVPGGRLTLVGAEGSATLLMPAAGPWSLQLLPREGERPAETEDLDWDWAANAIGGLTAALAIPAEVANDWFHAAQAVELTEAVEQSMARGRTIELHYDVYSDEATFKGRMSMYGCALLMLAPTVLCLVGFFGDALGLGKIAPRLPWPVGWLARSWGLLVLILLVVFLLLQAVNKLFSTAAPVSPRHDEEPPPG